MLDYPFDFDALEIQVKRELTRFEAIEARALGVLNALESGDAERVASAMDALMVVLAVPAGPEWDSRMDGESGGEL